MILSDKKKVIKSTVLVILVVSILVPALYRPVFDSLPFKSADAAGVSYVDAAFDRALIAFALARATNAIISIIQDSEIDIAPAGVGVTIAIGEALDPINDMIERFSWVMLVSLVSLGIQKLLIEISPWISVKLILLPALLMILAGLWCRFDWSQRLKVYGYRLIFLALLVRFCVPAVAMLNEQVYGLFLDQHYTTAVVGIEQGNTALRNMDPLSDNLESKKTEGLWEEIKRGAGKVGGFADLQHRISRMKSRMTGMIENLLKMIAVFILNTVILPVGFLWLIARFFRMLTSSDALYRLERSLLARIEGEGSYASSAGVVSETGHPGRNSQDAEVDEENKNVKTDQ